MKSVLYSVSKLMRSLGLPYQYGEWRGDVPLPFWVGESYLTGSLFEDGVSDGNVLLNVTADGRTSWAALYEQVEAIREAIGVSGYKTEHEGALTVLLMGGVSPVPSDLAGLKKLQVTLTFKEAKNYGNN